MGGEAHVERAGATSLAMIVREGPSISRVYTHSSQEVIHGPVPASTRRHRALEQIIGPLRADP